MDIARRGRRDDFVERRELRSNGFGSTTVVARYQSVTLSTPVAVTPTITSLTIQGSLNLNSVGETSALILVAKFTDTTTKEVSDGVRLDDVERVGRDGISHRPPDRGWTWKSVHHRHAILDAFSTSTVTVSPPEPS